MKTLEEAAGDVIVAWESRKMLKPHIEELKRVLLYIAKEKKVEQ